MLDATAAAEPTIATPPKAKRRRAETEAQPAQPLRRRLRVPLLTSLFVQVVLVMGDRMPSVDAMSYFETGRNVVNGNGYTRHGAPEMHFPPIAPVGLGGFEKLFGSEMMALRTWNLAWGLAIVALLTVIAWVVSHDDDATVATAWFATLVPGVVILGIRSSSGSEIPAVTFVLAAALVALISLDPDRTFSPTKRILGLAGSGALVGLAYLTRPEFLMPGMTIGLAIAIQSLTERDASMDVRLRRMLVRGAAFGFSALLLIGPYVSYQHANSGKWSLTSKTRDASIDAWRAVAEDDRLERDQILYAIQPDGHTLGPETIPLETLAREHPRGWVTIGWINVRNIATEYFGTPWKWGPVWNLLPVFLLVTAAIQMWTTRRRRSTMLFAAVGAWPLLTCTLFFALPRYLVLTTAVLIPFGAWGLARWLRTLERPKRSFATAGIILLTIPSFLAASWSLLPGSNTAERTEQRTAGLWLAENTPEDARVMTRSFHVQGYSEREVVAFPYADYLGMMDYAKRMGVDYIVADETTIRRRRPELYDILMQNDEAPDGLVLAHEFTQRGQVVKIFKLDPEAPESKYPPLWLGYVSD